MNQSPEFNSVPETKSQPGVAARSLLDLVDFSGLVPLSDPAFEKQEAH